ncbi:P-loop NTPase fold protein, partial [Enterobacter hormaechei]|uniref:P-loop NTPase fold protein n=1 Tax=Enterobacter hormaechei TaxID=158836 RepID=UPI003315807A
LRKLWNRKCLDAAVENVPEDRYGFSNIAENISRSILSLPNEASNVVGIEGAWGSGKTSLLNLILKSFSRAHACSAYFTLAERQRPG